jgi:hypothetical protein
LNQSRFATARFTIDKNSPTTYGQNRAQMGIKLGQFTFTSN